MLRELVNVQPNSVRSCVLRILTSAIFTAKSSIAVSLVMFNLMMALASTTRPEKMMRKQFTMDTEAPLSLSDITSKGAEAGFDIFAAAEVLTKASRASVERVRPNLQMKVIITRLPGGFCDFSGFGSLVCSAIIRSGRIFGTKAKTEVSRPIR